MQDRQSLIRFIRQVVPFREEMAAGIAAHFHYRELAKGEVFLVQGRVSSEYLFVESGFIRAYLNDTEGNEVTVNFYTPNSVALEVASFFQRLPTQENMQALTICKCWALNFEQLNTLFHTIPEFREFGRALLVKGFVALKVRTLSMINQTAEQRYEALLKSEPELLQNASLKHIASYLGVTDTSLSRIRKEFARK
jgi:CRP-like cAMP-binding protein